MTKAVLRTVLVMSSAFAAACGGANDRTLPSEPNLVVLDNAAYPQDEGMREAARSIAISLGDGTFRRQLFRELQFSRLPEHKVEYSRFVGTARAEFEAAYARRSGNTRSTPAIAPKAERLALYVPVLNHRKQWTGDSSVVVAVELSDGTLEGFDVSGRRIALDASRPPEQPVVALVASELRVETGSSPGRLLSDSTFRGNLTAGMLIECGETIEDCGGGGGGGGGSPAVVPPSGVYMTQMTVWDKAEPWIRGDPEIEIVIRGTVSGRYYATPFSPGFPATLQYESGSFIVPIGCAGRLAPTDYGTLRRFDFNNEGGAVYNQQVLIEAAAGFAVTESAEGPFGAVLFSRTVPVLPPYYIQVWERDDGGECPTPAGPWFPSFRVGFRFNTAPVARITGVAPTGSANDWFTALGITNENDLMGAWSFSDWTSVQAISSATAFSGPHVSIRLTNSGLGPLTIPQP
ncbi:hypothetical protein [Gemmatimonas sp.]|uniref:hypothetical protein n=1 Tax=Gemmatimonas sp. TaxID=1962908 RepID=UPI00333FDB9B